MTHGVSETQADGWIAQPEQPALSVRQRIALLEQTILPHSTAAGRIELAGLYMSLGRAEDAARMLEKTAKDQRLDFKRRMSLAAIGLASDDADMAIDQLDGLSRLADNAADLASLHSTLGKAYTLRGDHERASSHLQEALSLQPANSLAWSRYGDLGIEAENYRAVLQQATEAAYLAHPNSGLLSARQRALFYSGEREHALDISGISDGPFHDRLVCPPGWENIESFNADLARELAAHPDSYHPVSTGPNVERLRSNGLLFGEAPACAYLAEGLIEHVTKTAQQLDDRRLWMTGRPEKARIKFWSMRTRQGGYDAWHYHTQGWLSGVYYVQTAPSSHDGEAGSIGFAPVKDDHHVGMKIAPAAGEVVLFPSQLFHRTYPTTTKDWRISVAFDVFFA